MSMTESDRLVVESVTAGAIAEGADVVARSIQIHRRHLVERYKDLERLTMELAATKRAIAIREAAIEKLAGR